MSHRIERYTGGRDDEITAMVLAIQNGEYGLDLTVADQPDLADIPRAYAEGGFWVAIGADDVVIGSIGLLRYGARQGVLKKFFVAAPYRAGFEVIDRGGLPEGYRFPDRDSLIFRLKM